MYEERIFASSFVFLVVSFEFLPQLKAIFWCNPCVGKRDTTSFSPKTLVEMWNTCYRKHSCTDREKRKQKKTQENQRCSKERAGWSEENIGSSKVALLWRMHVPVMLLKSSYDFVTNILFLLCTAGHMNVRRENAWRLQAWRLWQRAPLHQFWIEHNIPSYQEVKRWNVYLCNLM